MAERNRAKDIAANFVTADWFRAIGPKVFPPMHRAMARLSGGRWHPGATIVLTTTGAKSGDERKTPLESIVRTDGSFLIVGSNFAGDNHPAWSWNLIANHEAKVLYRGVDRPVLAALLEGDERAHAWQEALDHWPAWQDYTDLTDRTFRIFHLVPVD